MPRRTFAARLALALLALAAPLGLLSCGGGDPSGPDAIVAVRLIDYSVLPSTAAVEQGRVLFSVTNDGAIAHSFLVVRTNLPANLLPTNPNGTYVENGPGTELVGKILSIPPGGVRSLELDLEPGGYILLSNMLGPSGADYALAMRVVLTVT